MQAPTQMPVAGRAPSQSRICEKCRQRAGNVYIFHYGQKKSRTSYRNGNRTVYKTTFAVGGKKDGVACDACIRRRRVIEAVLPVLGIAALAVFGWWVFFQEGLAGWMMTPEKDIAIKWTVMALACLCILMGIHELYLRLFGSKAGPGERLLIALKKGELRKQGFDSFWDTENFEKLR